MILLAFAVQLGCSRNTDDNEEQFKPKKSFEVMVTTTGSSMVGVLPDTHLRQIDFAARFDDLQEHDIVLFWDYTSDGYTLHEVVAKQGELWITKGSNPVTNHRADRPFLMRDNFIGKYTGSRLDQ